MLETGVNYAQWATRFGGSGNTTSKRQRDMRRRSRESAADSSIVNPADLDAARSSEVCGQCHGVFQPSDLEESRHSIAGGFRFVPGAELASSKHALHKTNLDEPRVIAALVCGLAVAGLLVAEWRGSRAGVWVTKPLAAAAFLAATLVMIVGFAHSYVLRRMGQGAGA